MMGYMSRSRAMFAGGVLFVLGCVLGGLLVEGIRSTPDKIGDAPLAMIHAVLGQQQLTIHELGRLDKYNGGQHSDLYNEVAVAHNFAIDYLVVGIETGWNDEIDAEFQKRFKYATINKC